MICINESKEINIITKFNMAEISAMHTLNFYDSNELTTPEFDYDADSYEPSLNDEDSDTLSEVLSEYLTARFSRGLSSIDSGDTIYLQYDAHRKILELIDEIPEFKYDILSLQNLVYRLLYMSITKQQRIKNDYWN